MVTLTCSSQKLVEKASEIGLNHQMITPDLMGGGIAFFDFDNDGFEDIAMTGGRGQDHLYKNLGNGQFANVTSMSGMDNSAYFRTMGVNAGDLDNDGFKEIIIVTDKRNENILYKNNQDGTFTNISIAAGFGSQRASLASVLLDVNLDGLLDIYIINWVKDGDPNYQHTCYENQLYINNGNLQFTLANDSYAINDQGCGVAAISTDFNNDNIPDLYIANDFGPTVSPNAALINQFPQPLFSSMGFTNGLGEAIYGMGISAGDFNNDGRLDYYTSNLGSNLFLVQSPNNQFINRAAEYDVENQYSGSEFSSSWGSVIVDMDHDGYEEILVSNGYIPTIAGLSSTKLDSNRLFKNIGGQYFEDISKTAGFFSDKISRGMAISDYDNDGDMDLALINILQSGGEVNMEFYENQLSDGNWLKIKLQGTVNNRDGYGAKVKVYDGAFVNIDEVQGGASCTSLNSNILHFGLGNISEIDSIEVIWPGGLKESFTQIAANQTYLVVEKGGLFVLGCMDQSANNYNSKATMDFGCFIPVFGCTDPEAINYNPLATNLEMCEYLNNETILTFGSSKKLQVFPTIVEDYFNIQMQEIDDEKYQIQVIDLNGKVHLNQLLKTENEIIYRRSIPTGMYVLRIISSVSGQMVTTKLVFK